MTVTPTLTTLTTLSGAPLPMPALPQSELLTVNLDQIPVFRDLAYPGIHIQPLRIDVEKGEWVYISILEPGCALPLHYHTGTAEVWTISGRWEYHEYPDQPQTAGSYLYEPAGSVHTFFTPADNTEDTIVLAWIQGAQVSFNEDGTFHSVVDAAALQFLMDNAEAAQDMGPVPYIRQGGAVMTTR